jgi:hypothetical protein
MGELKIPGLYTCSQGLGIAGESGPYLVHLVVDLQAAGSCAEQQELFKAFQDNVEFRAPYHCGVSGWCALKVLQAFSGTGRELSLPMYLKVSGCAHYFFASSQRTPRTVHQHGVAQKPVQRMPY